MYDSSRRNPSSDEMSALQALIPATRTTFQETPLMGTCLMSVQEGMKYLRKSCYHYIKCTASTFLAAFIWRIPLNSAVSTTTIHGTPKKIADETYTQVGALMMNKYTIRIV